jgi:Zn-dependent oligopeptidase
MSNRMRGLVRLHLILFASAGTLVVGLPIGAAAAPGGLFSPPKTSEDLQTQVKGHLARAQVLLDSLVAVPAPHTVENTLTLMNELSREISNASDISSLMQNVHPEATVRTTAEKASQEVQAFATDLSLNRKVYDALKTVDVAKADAVTKRLLEHTLRDYRRSGVDKDAETRVKIKKLREELVQLGQDFDRNIREGTRSITLKSADELAGLPPDYVAAHKPDGSGKITITTQYPDYIPFMSYAKSGEARKRLYFEYQNRAYPQNKDVLEKILQKRNELAETLGYRNWAHYVTEDKMVASPENAADFLEKLNQAARTRAERDYAMLLERKKRDDPSATAVADYEKSYYSELVKAEQFDFNSQELRDYYDYPKVKQGILDITAKMFGVTYRPMTNPEVWEPSVEGYEVYESDRLLGRFYLDMHPREGKYSHAAQFGLRRGLEGEQVPEAVLVCNLPGGTAEGPALLEHDDVETFLHEFGHLLHSLFGGHQKWVDLSGIATEWDFVEAPSQMLEEWSLDPGVLQTFARHYKTGEPIPAALVEKLRASKDFGNGIYVAQQTFYSALSLNIYNRDPDKVDLNKMLPEMQTRYSLFAYVPETHQYASFGHLEGYSAMYYTYMWSLVIAKDLFSKFDAKNLLDPKVATEYRRKVLEPGGSEDAADLVKDFLGRPYSFTSFQNWLNHGAS